MDTRQTRNGFAMGRLALALLLAATPVALVACSSTVGGNSDGADDDGADGADGADGDGADGDGEPLPGPESVDAVDVLLVVDGSGSMADKQVFLAQSFRPFLERLRNPRCIDAAGDAIDAQPATPADPCPAGAVREYTPDVTVHVGVVSSSLGAAGSDAMCAGVPQRLDDDGGRLVHRSPGSVTNDLPTYQSLGFFAWDPAGRLAPAGESDFDAFASGIEAAIRGVGEIGCGVEQPLEAMYRFLADPAPRADLEDPTPDSTVLMQRAAFLRPDSVLSVILLSDENDASLRADAIGRFSASPHGTPMPRPRAECAANPADVCCASCIEPVPAGCSGDGGCAAPGDMNDPGNFLAEGDPEANINIRWWESKRRFGIEFLMPTSRYVEALTSPTLTVSATETATNPIFAGGRLPHRVLYTAVVGVPWQLLTVVEGEMTNGFQTPAQMRERGTWDRIVGDPAAYVPATDPHMVESPLPRPGLPTYPEVFDPISGGERETDYGDLQYACVFDLPAAEQRDCTSVATGVNCDCADDLPDPLCAPDDPTTQIRAKAYPGLRQLAVAKELADQGRVVPMCAPLVLPGGEGVPGEAATTNLEIGLGSIADDVASRMHE